MTRAVKLELMDPESLQFSEHAAPDEDEHSGASISAGLRALRVIGGEHSLQQIDVDEDAPVVDRRIVDGKFRTEEIVAHFQRFGTSIHVCAYGIVDSIIYQGGFQVARRIPPESH